MGTSVAGHNCGEGREVFTRFVICVFLSLLQLPRQASKRACKSIQMSFVVLKSVKGRKCYSSIANVNDNYNQTVE